MDESTTFILLYSMIKTEIIDKELLLHMAGIEQDGMSVFVAADGLFRGALFNGTRFINQMRAQHNLGILETLILGQACLCGALMIQTMKGREHLNFRYDTNGPATGFSVEADSLGYVRGFLLQNPVPIFAPLENWDLSPFFGSGTLSISRFPEVSEGQTAKPQTGMVEIQHKNIAKDLTWYFEQSEQTHTAFNTSIQFDKEGHVVGAGGLFVQRMPSTGGYAAKGKKLPKGEKVDNKLTERMERALSACSSLGQWFSEKGSREDLICGLFREFGPTIALERNIVFDCPCSQERYTNAMRRLDASEVADMKKNGPDPLEIVCNNCASVYHIPVSEL